MARFWIQLVASTSAGPPVGGYRGAAVARGVVGGRDGDAMVVEHLVVAITSAGEDGVGEDGDGGVVVIGGDDGGDAVAREDFQCGVVGGDVHGMAVFLGKEEGAGDALVAARYRRWLWEMTRR